jgi:hypothetical protein
MPLAYKNTLSISSFNDFVGAQENAKERQLDNAMSVLFEIFGIKHIYDNFHKHGFLIKSTTDTHNKYQSEFSAYDAQCYHEDFLPYYIKFVLDKTAIEEEQLFVFKDAYKQMLMLIEIICNKDFYVLDIHLPKLKRYYVEQPSLHPKRWEEAGLHKKKDEEQDATNLYLGNIHKYTYDMYTFFDTYSNPEYLVISY